MSFQIEIDPSLVSATPGGDAVELRVWKDDPEECDTDLLCTVLVGDQQGGVHIQVLDARGRQVAYLVDGLLKSPHKVEDKLARAARVGKIAAFLAPTLYKATINRGILDGIELGAVYSVLSNDQDRNMIALLRVNDVELNYAVAGIFWGSWPPDHVRPGWHDVYRLDSAEA